MAGKLPVNEVKTCREILKIVLCAGDVRLCIPNPEFFLGKTLNLLVGSGYKFNRYKFSGYKTQMNWL